MAHPVAPLPDRDDHEERRLIRVTILQASIATLVPVRTITRWVDLGRITSDYDGMTLVYVEEIEELDALRDTLGRLPRWTNAA